jgi:hypothetical protein
LPDEQTSIKVSIMAGKKKHTLVALGCLGLQRVYLDIPVEEAVRRYTESEGSPPPYEPKIVEFNEEFYSYEVGEGEQE